MIRIASLAALLLAAPAAAQTATPSTPAAPAASEEAAVRAALQHYLNGQATGSGAEYSAAMHPEMRMTFNRAGVFTQRTAADFIAGASGRPAADEAQRRRWIESVDVTGDAAQAKIILDYPTARLTDYMNLLKVDGEWRIVHKTFHAQPKR